MNEHASFYGQPATLGSIPNLNSLFEPRSVAFIGASNNVFKWGFIILHHLVNRGFQGRVFPVNPQGGTWFGHEVYPDLDRITEPIDLAVIVVKDTLVLDTVKKCIAKNIPFGIVITAGFSETGSKGAELEKEIVNVARAGGMRLVGPNTMGVFSAYPSIMHILMSGVPMQAGSVGMIAQSGNIGSSISYRFLRRKIGISRLISSGNEGDLNTEDFLEYLGQDSQTRIICLYVEGLRDGQRFFETARRISVNKPIILLKGGRTDKGAQAALSHTGAVATNDNIFNAMCRQARIIQVETMDEMIDVAGILNAQPLPGGNRVGIITMGGGWGVIATDMCIRNGLVVEPLEEHLLLKLDSILPKYWSRDNPIDLVAPSRVEVITDSINILMEHTSIDTVLVMGLGYMILRAIGWKKSKFIPQELIHDPAESMISQEMNLFRMVMDLIKKHGKPVIPVIDLMMFDMAIDNSPLDYLDSQGIMAYPCPESAVRALAKVVWYASARNC